MPNPFDQNVDDKTVDPYEGKDAKEIMADLVGEGKKYKTVEEAVKALAYAQNHISTLEGETAKLREAQLKSKTMEDVMALLGKQPAAPEQKVEDDDPSKQTTEQSEDVEATVKRLLEQHTSQSTAQANHAQVVAAMKEKFGTKAYDVWDQVEKELGISLEQMAQSSPAATLKLLGISGDTKPSQSAATFQGDAKVPQDHEERPPEGSKRLVDYLYKKGEIDRKKAYHLKLQYASNPDKYNA